MAMWFIVKSWGRGGSWRLWLHKHFQNGFLSSICTLFSWKMDREIVWITSVSRVKYRNDSIFSSRNLHPCFRHFAIFASDNFRHRTQHFVTNVFLSQKIFVTAAFKKLICQRHFVLPVYDENIAVNVCYFCTITSYNLWESSAVMSCCHLSLSFCFCISIFIHTWFQVNSSAPATIE